ncbi:MAG: MoaD/ThiS family protein [Thermoplasmatota archaeon]
MARVFLPKSLRHFWSGPETVDVPGANLADVIRALNAAHPGLTDRVVDEQGRIRPYVHVFVNRKAVGDVAPSEVRLQGDDSIHIVPSVAGGDAGALAESAVFAGRDI